MSAENAAGNFAADASGEKGAPMWVVTFGDLMSLLLCFFVLMLSFSEMDRKKYRVISGSMKNAFGIQRKLPKFESPKGVRMIAKEFDQAIVLPAIQKVSTPLMQEIADAFPGMQDDEVKIEANENTVTIRLLGEATFDTGRADIHARFLPLLQRIGQLLEKTRGEIVITGHTDDVPLHGGPFRTNMGLSAARATAIAEFFLTRTDIDAKRISTMGCGEHRPLMPNLTAEARRQNRRVEIILTRQ
jgi:chemotaxis protein MotB